MKRSSIILILLLVFLAYIGSVVIPMYYKHQMMVLEVRGQIKVAHLYDESELLERIIDKVYEWKIPVDTDEILVDRREHDIIISMKYHVDKLFFSRYKRRFIFKIRETGDIRTEDY